MPEASHYNVWSRSDDGAALLFNGLTGALVELDADEEQRIRGLLAAPDRIRRGDLQATELLRSGFLVERADDEIALLEARAMKGRAGRSGSLDLVVSPTWACNFRCDYCYVPQHSGAMTRETESAIEWLVAGSLKGHDLVEISWFGGEPLLRLETMLRLSAAVRTVALDAGKSFRSYATTNGYLLDGGTARRLFAAGIEFVHVTIDGAGEWHDRYRVLVDGGPTYRAVVANLREALAAEPRLHVTIRSNVDEANIASVPTMLEEFESAERSRIQVSVTPIKGAGREPSPELYRSINRVVEQALEMGYRYYGVQLPRARTGFCMADKRGNYHIGPDGSLYCCTPADAKQRAFLGRLLADGTPELVADYEARYSEEGFHAECRECEHLCYCMGGCPLERNAPRDGSCRTRYEDGEGMVRNLWRAAV